MPGSSCLTSLSIHGGRGPLERSFLGLGVAFLISRKVLTFNILRLKEFMGLYPILLFQAVNYISREIRTNSARPRPSN